MVSFLRKFFKKKKLAVAEEEVRYILKKQLPGQGMTKVAELKEPTPIDDLYQNLTPGIYSLHKYKKGQSGFEVEWGPVEVTGEAPVEKAAPTRRASPFAGLREYAEEMKAAKEDLVVVLDVLAPLAGFTKMGDNSGAKPKTLLEEIREAKAQQKDLNEFFPLSTTGTGGTQQIPISGTIPAWLAYTPQVIDTAMDSVEKRLSKWGLVEAEGVGGSPKQEIIKLPEKPRAKTEEVAKGEGVIKLPGKPNVEEEDEEKEEKESGESGKGK